MAGGQVNLGLGVAEVEWLRLGVTERKGVLESAGEAREIAERVGRRRQQVYRRGDVPVLRLRLLIGLDSAVSDGLQRLGS